MPRADPADLEPYEGMLVRLHQTLTVTESFQLGRFGQVVVSSGGRLRQPTALIRATDTAAVQAAQHANDLNQLIIDDDNNARTPIRSSSAGAANRCPRVTPCASATPSPIPSACSC